MTLLSEPRKLPYMLHARAERAFGKGELVLAPYGGELQQMIDEKFARR